jgi:ABC-2 type transport system ATP-binding protein
MTPKEFLMLSASLCGMTHDAGKKRVTELTRLVGLEGVKKRIGSFSRGMKQRIGIAQALINEPDVVLMDEPVSALDPEGRYEVIEILRQIKGRTTVFFSTHILSDIERVCDSAAIIRKGKILEHGSVMELKQRYDRHRISIVLPSDIDAQRVDDFLSTVMQRSWACDVERSSPHRFRITVGNRRDAQIDVPKLLSAAGLPMESMDSVSVSLEDVFLEVIRQ